MQVFITTCGQLLEPVLMLRKLLSPSNSSSLVPELGNEILNELDSITASLFSRYRDALDCDQFMLTYHRSFIAKVSINVSLVNFSLSSR